MDADDIATVIDTKRHWVILGVVYLCILAFAITLQSVPPVLSLSMAELQLSHTQGGLIMSLFALPGIVISIPAAAGAIKDVTGSYQASYALMASWALLITLTMVTLGWRQRQRRATTYSGSSEERTG